MTWNNHPRRRTDKPCSWSEQGTMGVLVEHTEVGPEVSIYEYWPVDGEWDRRYTMDDEAARNLLAALDQELEREDS